MVLGKIVRWLCENILHGEAFYVINRCRYGTTEKNRLFRVMTIFKKGCHSEPEVEYFF